MSILSDDPGAIIVSPLVYDALRAAGLLKEVSYKDNFSQFGWDEDDFGNVRCWLVDGASALRNNRSARVAIKV